MSKMSINKFLRQWNEGGFDESINSMVDAGWYDWFCQDKSLYNRLKAMIPAVRRISGSSKVNVETMYVFFKNNCPMWVNTTYDDFRICDMKTDDVLYTICPRYPAPHLSVTTKKRFGRPMTRQNEHQGYLCEVWDNIADNDELQAIHIENLAQGKPVNDLRTVVYGTRKEMYDYFGV